MPEDQVQQTAGDDAGAEAHAEEAQAKVQTAPQPHEDEAVDAFATLGLKAESLRAVRDLGFGLPTPVQQQTIPPMLDGRDVIAQAPTGTGKTAAFGFPIVEHLNVDRLAPQALIVVPTRELCIQVSEAMASFGKYRELVSLPIYGGQPYDRQFRALARGVQVVVGTPGRLLDHIQRGTVDLSGIQTVVLDEADEMLDMGFIEDIESILSTLPEERQSALFSATLPPRITRLAEQYLREPVRVSVAAREAVAPRVRQVYYELPYQAKPEALARILDLETPESAIVFVNTRREADSVAEELNGLGYTSQAIHGEITQAQRERALDRFRNGRTQVLVATDVAARGLDIPDVSHIINYDLPLDADSYVHRIGRTGRAGRTGEAVTLVTPRERRQLRLIEQSIRRRLERLRLPTVSDVAARRRAAFREDLLQILSSGQLDPYLSLVEDLVGTRDPAEVAAAAFKMAAQAREAHLPGSPLNWIEMPPAPPQPEAEREEELAAEHAPRRGRRERGAERGFERGAERGFERGGPRTPERGMARLFLRVGRRDGVRPTDVVGAIANEAGMPGDAIGDIDLYDTFSFVEVPEEDADRVRAALNQTTIRGRPPKATLARPGSEWPEPDMGDGRDIRRRSFEREPSGPRRPLRAPFAARRPAAGGRRGAGRPPGGFERSGPRRGR